MQPVPTGSLSARNSCFEAKPSSVPPIPPQFETLSVTVNGVVHLNQWNLYGFQPWWLMIPGFFFQVCTPWNDERSLLLAPQQLLHDISTWALLPSPNEAPPALGATRSDGRSAWRGHVTGNNCDQMRPTTRLFCILSMSLQTSLVRHLGLKNIHLGAESSMPNISKTNAEHPKVHSARRYSYIRLFSCKWQRINWPFDHFEFSSSTTQGSSFSHITDLTWPPGLTGGWIAYLFTHEKVPTL